MEAIWEDEDPRGKTYDLKLNLKNGDGYTCVKYVVRVDRVEDKVDESGDRCLMVDGFGTFRPYHGEMFLEMKMINGRICSRAGQKIYADASDPIWKKRKLELVDVPVWVDEKTGETES